jgi:hypothetical protein
MDTLVAEDPSDTPAMAAVCDAYRATRNRRCGRRFLWSDEPAVGAERVDVDACQSEMGGLVTVGSSRSGPACLGSSVNTLWGKQVCA